MEEIYQAYPDIPIVTATGEESLDAAIRVIRCNVLVYILGICKNTLVQDLVRRAFCASEALD